MGLAELADWLSRYSGPTCVWYVKRLSGNDTLANGSHQAGPYIPKQFLFHVFPELNKSEVRNPDVWFGLSVDSHAPDSRQVRAVWYNNKYRGGTRDESRITNFGGAGSALLDPENTGALTILVFVRGAKDAVTDVRVWVCRNEAEEELVEDRIGPVEPGRGMIWPATLARLPGLEERRQGCWLRKHEIPDHWLKNFPNGREIIAKAIELRSDLSLDVDRRLLRRRECEFQLFRSIEEAVELPVVRAGFETVESFITCANKVLQRRKARSGRSLELHAVSIFLEEGLRENRQFAHQPESEPGRRPDFLFPSAEAYKDTSFPASRLRMLAVKTTCKDRWRQVLNEASRIKRKHLLTLQEGISEMQFREMTESGIRLVVPRPLFGKYPDSIRSELTTLADFIADVRKLGEENFGC